MTEVIAFTPIYETLTRSEEGARIVPWLAEIIEPEDSGRRYYFRLRPAVRFHDGRRLTSRDVRYSFEHFLLNRASVARPFLAPIRGASRLLDGQSKELEGFRIISSDEFITSLLEVSSMVAV